jgi:oligopeptide/dipeptide ABC transporter ATP-binding protein
MADRLLEVEDLQVSFVTEDGLVRAVDSVSFTLDRGEVLAIVGESGSGKSVSVMTLMGLTRGPNSRFGGSARLRGRELVDASEEELERIRGKEIAMIFQDPISSLSPVHRIGDQIVEQGTLDEIFYDPQHPYTWGLLGSVTRMDREPPHRLPAIPGQPPSLVHPPQGCHFRPRCPHEFDRCTETPPLEQRVSDAPGHCDRCWLSVEEKRDKRLVEGQIGLVEGAVS